MTVQVEAEERRHAEERRLWEQAERERQAHLMAQDLEQAQSAVDHLRSIRPGLLQGSVTSLEHPQADGNSLPVWRTEPQVSSASVLNPRNTLSLAASSSVLRVQLCVLHSVLKHASL